MYLLGVIHPYIKGSGIKLKEPIYKLSRIYRHKPRTVNKNLKLEEIVTKISNSPEETIKLGEDLARNFNPGDVVALYGKLGAGKTTFVQGVCKTLDTETPSSPSYVIINQYQGKHVVYHIDLYRISSDEELHDLGLEEYLYGNGITLMEWAEKARSVLPERRIEIYFEVTNEHSRELKIVNYN